MDDRTFKYEVMISFWLATHMGKLPEAQFLYNLDPLIQKVVKNLRQNGRRILAKKNERTFRRSQSIFSTKKKKSADSVNDGEGDDSEDEKEKLRLSRASEHAGEGEYEGIELENSDDEEDEDRPRGNKRYDKLKKFLTQDLS